MTDTRPDELVRVRTADGWETNVSRALAEASDDLEILNEPAVSSSGVVRRVREPGDPAETDGSYESMSRDGLVAEIDLRNHRAAGALPDLPRSGSKTDLIAVLGLSDEHAAGRVPDLAEALAARAEQKKKAGGDAGQPS